jgi:formate hydrogenlyase subunit 3/multisubunit Na+/H+ antiporter MnhD subunit
MLDTVPVLLQAITWPLVGAAIVLTVGRVLPNWLRRLVAVAFGVGTLVALWSLRSGGVEQVEIFWEPVNLFRMSPVFRVDGLSLLAAMTLAVFTAVAVLGIRGSVPQKTAWHGLILIALAGCLVMAFAANMLALAVASALIDLALVAITASAAGSESRDRRSAWRMTVPGIASTVLLLAGALWMDTQVGHASLLGREFPSEVLVLIGVAGLLRLMIYPLFPSRVSTPETAAAMLLPVGMGIYLLARVQSLAPVLPEQRWMPILGGIALLAGGLLAWTSGNASHSGQTEAEKGPTLIWSSLAIHQTGYAVLFVVFVDPTIPWPLPGLVFALGALAIWWDGNQKDPVAAEPGSLESIRQELSARWDQARSSLAARFPALGRWRESWAGKHLAALLPAVALASLAGLPLTAGAIGRWSLYAQLLHDAAGALLIVILIADALLVAGLWVAMRGALEHASARRTRPGALVALVLLAGLIVALGVVPGTVTDALGLEAAELPDVSVWGLGLLYVLPWLAGSWLARASGRLEDTLAALWRVASLDWLYRAADWVGRRLAGAVLWLGLVGEGEGWWGWALIIMALGTIFLATG